MSGTGSLSYVSVETIVSQKGDKVDDLFDMFFTVCFICNKDLPCNNEEWKEHKIPSRNIPQDILYYSEARV